MPVWKPGPWLTSLGVSKVVIAYKPVRRHVFNHLLIIPVDSSGFTSQQENRCFMSVTHTSLDIHVSVTVSNCIFFMKIRIAHIGNTGMRIFRFKPEFRFFPFQICGLRVQCEFDIKFGGWVVGGIHLDFANPSSLIRNCKFTSFVIDRISRNPADPRTAFVKRTAC